MNHYISDHPHFSEELEDVTPTPYDETHFDSLVEAGIPNRLAKHLAKLFAHDALVIYKGHTDYDEN